MEGMNHVALPLWHSLCLLIRIELERVMAIVVIIILSYELQFEQLMARLNHVKRATYSYKKCDCHEIWKVIL